MILTWNLDQHLNVTGETWQCQKNLTMTLCQQIVTSLSFFQFMVNLEQFRSQILNTWSVKFILSWIVSIYLTKTKNSTKKPLTHFSYYWVKVLFFAKKWENKSGDSYINQLLSITHTFFTLFDNGLEVSSVALHEERFFNISGELPCILFDLLTIRNKGFYLMVKVVLGPKLMLVLIKDLFQVHHYS